MCGSYLLLNDPSIGYVWIMRVFLLIALVLPIISKPVERMPNWLVLICFLMLVFSQPFLVFIGVRIPSELGKFIYDETIPYLAGYITYALIGLQIRSMKLTRIIMWVIVLSSVYIIVVIVFSKYNLPLPVNKYPPEILYLIKGAIMCMLLWAARPLLLTLSKWEIWGYMSRNILWIYMWHIIPAMTVSSIPIIRESWPLRYIFVFIAALALNYIYQKIASNTSLPKQ